jgi:hypothetical protein
MMKSRYGKVLLNQGAIEQILLNFLKEQQNISIEMHKKAERLHISSMSDQDNKGFPVSLGVRHTGQGTLPFLLCISYCFAVPHY